MRRRFFLKTIGIAFTSGLINTAKADKKTNSLITDNLKTFSSTLRKTPENLRLSRLINNNISKEKKEIIISTALTKIKDSNFLINTHDIESWISKDYLESNCLIVDSLYLSNTEIALIMSIDLSLNTIASNDNVL